MKKRRPAYAGRRLVIHCFFFIQCEVYTTGISNTHFGRTMHTQKGNALVGIIVIILVLIIGGVYFWNSQIRHAKELRAVQNQANVLDGFDQIFLSDDAGEQGIIEADTDVRSLNDQIKQTSFDSAS